MVDFDIYVYVIAGENLFHPCKIGRTVVRYPAGHRPMLPYTGARTICDRCPGDYQICKSLKSRGVSFICDNSIIHV